MNESVIEKLRRHLSAWDDENAHVDTLSEAQDAIDTLVLHHLGDLIEAAECIHKVYSCGGFVSSDTCERILRNLKMIEPPSPAPPLKLSGT